MLKYYINLFYLFDEIQQKQRVLTQYNKTWLSLK